MEKTNHRLNDPRSASVHYHPHILIVMPQPLLPVIQHLLELPDNLKISEIKFKVETEMNDYEDLIVHIGSRYIISFQKYDASGDSIKEAYENLRTVLIRNQIYCLP